MNRWCNGKIAIALAAGSLATVSLAADDARTLTITSSAFTEHGSIPVEYTCDGEDASPPLSWSGVPSRTRGLALIVDDPDAPDPAAPRTIWVHWVLYNLPSDSTGLAAGVARTALPRGTREGRNDWHRTGYRGPCPPVGRHRYRFTLYALDIELPDMDEPSKTQLLKAVQGHVIADATLAGTYRRSR